MIEAVKALMLGACVTFPHQTGDGVAHFEKSICINTANVCISGITSCAIPKVKQSSICFIIEDYSKKQTYLVPRYKIQDFINTLRIRRGLNKETGK